jgi:flagellar biosynthesis/type III secretory pathway protein FliH
MSKAEEATNDFCTRCFKYGKCHKVQSECTTADSYQEGYEDGYHQAEKDIKEELSNLFQEFMMDCINDSTDTHILHFIDVFNNKIKTIGNE